MPKCSPVVVIGVDRHGDGRDNSPRPRLPTRWAHRRVELIMIHNWRKSQPLGLRFRLVLTESDTRRLEWDMLCSLQEERDDQRLHAREYAREGPAWFRPDP